MYVCVRVCVHGWVGDLISYFECMCDCVWGWGGWGRGGAVLAVNGETVECRNMSTDCAPNRYQTRCFILFYYVLLRFLFYLCTLTFVMLNCLLVLFNVEFD